jgi:NAD(P)-dependent dehydrogenase (short-subunit alcohol dehydrogenase family)
MPDYDLTGKVVLITGATDGHGRGLALEAERLGATVLVHGRSQERIDAVPSARSYKADLASLDDVRSFAAAVLDNEPRIDVLVNNAGLGAIEPREESADGIELVFAVNYLSHYLLTRELLPIVKERIVQVSSAGQLPIDFDDPLLERSYSPWQAYAQSKLAQILHAVDLTENELAGTGVTANALHPSTFMDTKMVPSPTSKVADGVAATMRLVADPALEGRSGLYFNVQREARADDQAYDPSARAALRELSERLVSVSS